MTKTIQDLLATTPRDDAEINARIFIKLKQGGQVMKSGEIWYGGEPVMKSDYPQYTTDRNARKAAMDKIGMVVLRWSRDNQELVYRHNGEEYTVFGHNGSFDTLETSALVQALGDV